ncbi:MFS transporter [Sulfuracidifex tepidarius]|uniref:MFS transporter n=1 Tax=Sulfuracidifex tepidarius TaxID=1294262 RepID=UPI0006D1419C|nr:MFS transporter [Sulfuracidifex tepidarius]
MKKEVYKLSFSAFFADLGYMAVMSFLPLLITVYYGLSPAVYGIIEAVNYGGGAVMSFLGGLAADKYGRRLVGSVGNSLIALMSLSGIVGNPLIALLLIVGVGGQGTSGLPQGERSCQRSRPQKRGKRRTE